MKKINFKILILTCIVTLLPILLGVFYYDKLPDQVAVHFDINNNPNNYFSKDIFVFALPLFMTFIQIISCLIADLADTKNEVNQRATNIFKWIIPIVTIILYISTIRYAFDNTLDIRKIAMIMVGIIFIVVGVAMPKFKGSNAVRLPVAVNEEAEEKILKLFGNSFIIAGVLAIISIFFPPIVSVATIGFLIIGSFVLSIYSVIKFK